MGRDRKKKRRRNLDAEDFRPFLRRPVAGPIFLVIGLVFVGLMFFVLRPAHTGTGMADAWQAIMNRPMPSQPNLALTTLFGILAMGALMLSLGTMPSFIVEVWAKLDQLRSGRKAIQGARVRIANEARIATQQEERIANEARIATQQEEREEETLLEQAERERSDARR